jgi:hypothetical protein
MAGSINHTILVTDINKNPMVLQSKGMGTQEAHKEMDIPKETVQIRKNAKGQIMLR